MKSKDLAYNLAEHVAGARYANLSPEVVAVTKKFVLDTLATTLAGSGAPGCEALAGRIAEDGGAPQSTLLVFGGRVPAGSAALVNGAVAHAIEFDDTHDPTTVHANASVIPAALAMAECTGSVSGERLIEAIAVGVDLACRLGTAIEGSTGWTPAVIFGYFGAAAAAARLAGFDAHRVHDAMGICYSQVAGNRQCNIDRALVKRVQLGFAARGGVQACQLAAIGITGSRDIFNGQVGLGNLYFDGAFRNAPVLDGLGSHWLGTELSIKGYPSCRANHACIDAVLDLVNAHDLRPSDIEQVTVHVTFLVMRTCGAPFDAGRISQVEAQFSVAYTTAVAIARRGVFLEDFVEDNIRSDRVVLDLARKVRVVQDQKPEGPGLTPVVVEIRTRDGRLHTQRTNLIRGNPRDPLDFDWVKDKFLRCARFAARPFERDALDGVMDAVSRLESLADVGPLIQRMHGPSRD